MTLWELPAQQRATVASLAPNLHAKVTARLAEMGVEATQEVLCLRKGPWGGPVIIQLGGSVFAVEKELAQHIHVHASH
ncbi:FeoA family protein [Alteromonas sp. C1M14]|uniref:FeoA family protein n=1 Tax=Alteromonas sp. C1M14 TaxID=2841567 RepID=UPI001C07F26C|nr:FeoA family protein [Alteromonas sp. C1M14]MBU2979956.1 ferrous iron transport protein A [Alteromonas sp. C1M14]